MSPILLTYGDKSFIGIDIRNIRQEQRRYASHGRDAARFSLFPVFTEAQVIADQRLSPARL